MTSSADAAENDIIVQWVLDNYDEDTDPKGPGVPRGDMYDRYANYSRSFLRRKPANTAVFGKAVRTVFPGIKTRRLGNRGNSKYHYCGIIDKHQLRNPPTSEPPFSKPRESANVSLPSFHIPSTENTETNTLLQQFSSIYHQHCTALLSLIINNQYQEVSADQCILSFSKTIPPTIQQFICSDLSVRDLIWRWDCVFYESIVTTSFPTFTTVSPTISPADLQQWLTNLHFNQNKAWADFPSELVEKKQDVAQIFADKFERYLSLYQLATSAAEGLEAYQSISSDWQLLDTLDFAEKIAWIMDDCAVKDDTILETLHSIGRLLESRSSIEEWIKFLENWVENFLRDRPSIQLARQMMQKWSLCSSLAMRELALKSVQSLDGFNRLQLFVNDFLTYLAEERIARINIEAVKSQSRQGSFMMMDESPYDLVEEPQLLSIAAPQKEQ